MVELFLWQLLEECGEMLAVLKEVTWEAVVACVCRHSVS
jgi:hypothetical protein